METVKDHYDRFLGSVYSWILGDFDNAREKNAAFFDSLDLAPVNNAIAVDLGCGPGCQSLPLAELGYSVLAIDFCQDLLDELGSMLATCRYARSAMICQFSAAICLDPPTSLSAWATRSFICRMKKQSRSVIDDVCDSLKSWRHVHLCHP